MKRGRPGSLEHPRMDGAAPIAPAVPWPALRRFTDARIGLGHAGASVPSDTHLQFRLDHARARDAVHLPLDAARLAHDLRQALGVPALAVHSAAADRPTYLRRPDLGRRLDDASRERLGEAHRADVHARFDLVLVVADGLSALAAERHTLPLLRALLPLLQDWSLAPIVVAEQARVALGDEIGERLDAACVVILLGERPGLSAPDSLGLYLSWAPRVGLTDAQRNCISNVRPEGLPAHAAAGRLAHLLNAARRLGASGLALKDDGGGSDPGAPLATADCFLLAAQQQPPSASPP